MFVIQRAYNSKGVIHKTTHENENPELVNLGWFWLKSFFWMKSPLDGSHYWRYWKRSVFIPVPKAIPNECSNNCTIAFISHANKIMLKILQATLQQWTENRELPDVQAGFRKGRGTRDQISNIHWIIEKARESASASLTMLMPLTVWIKTNCGKFLKRWKHKTTLPFSWEICM